MLLEVFLPLKVDSPKAFVYKTGRPDSIIYGTQVSKVRAFEPRKKSLLMQKASIFPLLKLL